MVLRKPRYMPAYAFAHMLVPGGQMVREKSSDFDEIKQSLATAFQSPMRQQLSSSRYNHFKNTHTEYDSLSTQAADMHAGHVDHVAVTGPMSASVSPTVPSVQLTPRGTTSRSSSSWSTVEINNQQRDHELADMIEHVETLCADMEDACSDDDIQMRDVLKVNLHILFWRGLFHVNSFRRANESESTGRRGRES
jgi:hypothetical protein